MPSLNYVAKPVHISDLEVMLEKWLPFQEKNDGDSIVKTASQVERARMVEETSTGITDSVLDAKVLDDLRSIDANLVGEMVKAFIEDTPSLLERLRIGLENQDRRQIMLAAHTLKSAAGNLGAMRLSQKCAELESIEANWSISKSSALVESIRTEVENATAELAKEIKHT